MHWKSFLIFILINLTTIVFAQNENEYIIHKVESGQTIYSIAAHYNVSQKDLIKLNPGSEGILQIGQQLRIPKQVSQTKEPQQGDKKYKIHTIAKGETLYSLSLKYNVAAEHIIKANPNLSTVTFREGREIKIPINEPKIPIRQDKRIFYAYTVKTGDTEYSLCHRFKISPEKLADINPNLKNGLKAGMILHIPEENFANRTDGSGMALILNEEETEKLLKPDESIQNKDFIKAALFLPFSTSKSDRFVEYYEGMLLAIHKLQEQGIFIDLHVFDSTESSDVNNILQKNDLENIDLIIGGVNKEHIHSIAEFADKHQINYVIPFSSNNEEVFTKSKVFQVNTPHSFIYGRAADAFMHIHKNDNIIIINTAKADKDSFIKELSQKLDSNHVKYTIVNYSDNLNTEILDYLKLEQRNVIVPNSGDMESLQNILTHIRPLTVGEEIQYNISFFGYPEWQTYKPIIMSDLLRLDTHIYSNFFVDNVQKNAMAFYRNYQLWFGRRPMNTYPKYGMLGYDTALFFFNAMNLFGRNFEKNMKQIKQENLQTHFIFNRPNDNGGFVNVNLFIINYNKTTGISRIIY